MSAYIHTWLSYFGFIFSNWKVLLVVAVAVYMLTSLI